MCGRESIYSYQEPKLTNVWKRVNLVIPRTKIVNVLSLVVWWFFQKDLNFLESQPMANWMENLVDHAFFQSFKNKYQDSFFC